MLIDCVGFILDHWCCRLWEKFYNIISDDSPEYFDLMRVGPFETRTSNRADRLFLFFSLLMLLLKCLHVVWECFQCPCYDCLEVVLSYCLVSVQSFWRIHFAVPRYADVPRLG